MINILWLRRDLRLHDHAALAAALAQPQPVQPLFVFDTDILARFANPHDRRLTFLAHALCELDAELHTRGGNLLVLHGKAEALLPKLVAQSGARIFASEDFEPDTLRRDKAVAAGADLTLVKDHLIFAPREVVKADGTPFKVFTPYANAWRAKLSPADYGEYEIHDAGRYAKIPPVEGALSLSGGPEALLAQIGYKSADIASWPVRGAGGRLDDFMQSRAGNYTSTRDLMAIDGTSRLSPYLRFGLVSIREAVRAIHEIPSPLEGEGRVGGGAAGVMFQIFPKRSHPSPCPSLKGRGKDKWLSELIWREFYAMILYHYPESATLEWNEKFRALPWSRREDHFNSWRQGKTGYPVVDAAMRQLLATGWMHNRARMIAASFLTKDLQIDWRWGEEHFAQHLMDYEMASNVGGWQWCAGTGTDAQPWFRIFNPMLQSEKFDPNGEYIRAYVPELAPVKGKAIHDPSPLERGSYPQKIVDHKTAREKTLAMFKALSP